jgi:hypothetical protein
VGGGRAGGRAPSKAGAAVTTVVSFRSGGQDWAVALERVQRVLGARGLLPCPTQGRAWPACCTATATPSPWCRPSAAASRARCWSLTTAPPASACWWTRSSASSGSRRKRARPPPASGRRWSRGCSRAPGRCCCSTSGP